MELINFIVTKAQEKVIPFNAAIELTLKCNLRCVHCYNFDRDTPMPARDAELTREEVFGLLGDLRRLGCFQVAFTGGEAMVHPDFFAFMDRARDLGLAVSVLTNGTTLTDEVVDRLAAYDNLVDTSLSVYGATASTHDAITQARGSYARTVRGAERLRDARIPVALKFIVMKGNVGEVEGMIALSKRMGVLYNVDTYIRPRHDGDESSYTARAAPEALAPLYRGPLRDLLPDHPLREMRPEEFTCNCAKGTCAIFSTGDVGPCISVPWIAGNIRERSFEEIWRHSPVFQRIRDLTMSDFKTCTPCPLKSYCNRSPGPAYILTGDYTGVDPWICEDAANIRAAVETP